MLNYAIIIIAFNLNCYLFYSKYIFVLYYALLTILEGTNMDIANQINSLKNNEEIEVKYSKKKKSKTPRYLTIGSGMTSKDFKENVVVDAFAVIGQLSKQQLEIFLYLRDLRVEKDLEHYNSKAINKKPNTVSIPKFKDDERAKQTKENLRKNNNGKTMIELGIIKKVKAGVYMINPYLLIPNDNFDEVAKQWDEIE